MDVFRIAQESNRQRLYLPNSLTAKVPAGLSLFAGAIPRIWQTEAAPKLGTVALVSKLPPMTQLRRTAQKQAETGCDEGYEMNRKSMICRGVLQAAPIVSTFDSR